MASFASTVVSRSPSSIISYLARLKTTHFDPSKHSFLFTLSPPSSSADTSGLDSSADLASLVNALMNFSPTSLGCLSAPLTGGSGTEEARYNPISCSVVLLDKQYSIPFRSTIPGRARTQVGRWHAFRLKDEDDYGGKWDDIESLTTQTNKRVDWEEVWSENADVKKDWSALPQELANLRQTPESIRQFLLFSDSSPEGLVSTLHSTFPPSSAFTLLRPPFITGRPVTLFENGKIHGSGSIGVAFTNVGPSELHLKLPKDLRPLGAEMTVTRAEGNLLNTLDNSNPTRLLLEAIRKAGIDAASEDAVLFKEEEEFYLGVGSGSQIYTITSGDPSRGTIALDTTRAPVAGEKVQFYHRSKRSASTSASSIFSANQSEPLVTFGVADLSVRDHTEGKGPLIMENVFITCSENGLWATRGASETPWTCTVSGCSIRSDL
ncbi:hypothetical protein VNI00_003459 [Paramarasmius palmivorus]|uniref:FIST domain-containing protein n=1 Tax=Paramarasmius palmivorus TaxID=297713 RepID=A0AAW0DUW1_9AGAR